jgi:H2-forming N5,N10-methylenetetrahydromethanopterin dehydrogenase-like enzyme
VETKELLTLVGAVGVVGAILYVVFLKVVTNYFVLQKQNVEIREDMVTERINWLKEEIGLLKDVISKNTSEQQQTRMKLQALDHEISGLKQTISKINQAETRSLEALGEVLRKMKSEIDGFGKILMGSLPEKRKVD